MDVQPNGIPSNCFILTNSPALHSLKRHQLVQLCKRNGIKATGKNAEIVEKLKAHALNMPADASLSQQTFSSDDYDKENRRFAMPRPSEQWTVIEEDSREIERVHLGLKDIRKEVQQEMGSMSTLKGFGASQTAGDFGNGTTSSKGSTMSSSIKAFATSLKRSNSKSSTALTPSTKLSTGPSSNIRLPMHTEEPPIDDIITTTTSYHEQQTYPLLPDPEPLDADDSRDQSMLELGASTIRLVTPNPVAESPPALRPFTPTFALSNSPGSPSVPSIYPSLSVDPDSDPSLPGGFPSMFSTPSAPLKTAHNLAPPSSPAPLFLFGSPAHRISNTDFNSAAATVLAEMNARLGLTGTSNEVGLDLLQNHRHEAQPAGLLPRQEKLTTDVKSKFDRAHEREFERMEGLGTWYAKRGPIPSGKPEASAGKKRKSDAMGGLGKRPARTSNVRARGASRVVTPGTRRSLVAAAVAEEDDGRRTKRVRISTADAEGRVQDKVPNADADPNSMEVDDATQKANEEREKERAAIKKRLEVSRARRRSSMGRVSVGAGRPSLIPNKPKKGIATKFGFLSSAKALVKNVWNKGITSEAQSHKPIAPTAPKPPLPTNKAVPKNPAPNVLTKAPPIPKPNIVKAAPAKTQTVKPDASTPLVGPSTGFGFGRKLSTHSRPNSALGTKSSLASSAGARSRADSTVGKKSTTSSTSRTRASSVSSATSLIPPVRRGPIPSFQLPMGRTMRTNSLVNGGTVRSRTSTISTVSSRGGSVGKPGSAGVKKSGLVADTSAGSSKLIGRQRASTLFAPTASSLARMQSTVRPRSMSGAGNSAAAPVDGGGLERVPEQQVTPPRKTTPTEIPTFTFTSPPPVGVVPISSNATGSIFTTVPSTLLPPPNPAESSTKPRALPPRRPRISRSRVIARLGAQRAVSGSSMNSNASSRRSLGAPKPRGSLSARASGVGVKDRRKEVAAAMSARKRLRQSEILRRRSRVVGFSPGMKRTKNEKTLDDDEDDELQDDEQQDDEQQDDDKQDYDKQDYGNDYGSDVNERYEEPNTTTDVSMGD